VTHRDVKPPNILVTRDDFAYLVDFGIASATTDEKLTQLGTAVGTWKYMAPERFSNAEVDYRADIYSLACVLYECLTGSPPYPSDSAGVLVSAHMMDPIPQPSAARSGIAKAFDRVIARGMAKKAQDRYASAGDLARAAHEALTNPDQNQAVNILRRGEESTLPGLKGAIQSVQHPRAPIADPASSGRMPRSSPAWRPTPAPDSRPMRGANQPANQPSPSPQYYQAGGGRGGGPPSAPQQFAGPAPWSHGQQPPPQRKRNPWVIVAGAAVLVLVLAAIGISLAMGGDDNNSPNAGHTTTTTTTTSVATTTATTTYTSRSTPPPDAQNRLLSLLPSGYPPGACKPEGTPMPGALVSVNCGQTPIPTARQSRPTGCSRI
jgi:serine/threonine kinase PknH